MKIDPDIEVPGWLRRMLSQNLEKRFSLADQRISVTGLLQPAHMLRLKEDHWHQLVVDPINLIPSAIGVAWHEDAARHDGDGCSELRVEVELDGWTISGQPDFFSEEVIIDRKTAKVWSKAFGKPEWEQQLNLYRWLLARGMGYDIPRLEVHVVYLDWIKGHALRHHSSGLFPQSRFEVLEIPIWDYDRCEAFIRERLTLLEMETPPLCSPEERWERGEHWGVMKKGRKSAVKRCDTLQEAVDRANSTTGGYVEHRPGEAVRCRSWCDVSSYCEFGRALEEVESNG